MSKNANLKNHIFTCVEKRLCMLIRENYVLNKYEISKNKYQSPLLYEQMLGNYQFKVISSVLSAGY